MSSGWLKVFLPLYPPPSALGPWHDQRPLMMIGCNLGCNIGNSLEQRPIAVLVPRIPMCIYGCVSLILPGVVSYSEGHFSHGCSITLDTRNTDVRLVVRLWFQHTWVICAVVPLTCLQSRGWRWVPGPDQHCCEVNDGGGFISKICLDDVEGGGMSLWERGACHIDFCSVQWPWCRPPDWWVI